MISGALFFLDLKLHRLTLSVDLTAIYHNICCVHRLRRPQRVYMPQPTKEHLSPPENRAETLRWFLAMWIVMHRTWWRRFSGQNRRLSHKTKTNR